MPIDYEGLFNKAKKMLSQDHFKPVERKTPDNETTDRYLRSLRRQKLRIEGDEEKVYLKKWISAKHQEHAKKVLSGYEEHNILHEKNVMSAKNVMRTDPRYKILRR